MFSNQSTVFPLCDKCSTFTVNKPIICPLQPKAYISELKANHSGGKRILQNPVLEEEIQTPDLLLQNPDLLAALELFLPNSELM
jgi:hypothetical protein